MTAGTRRDLCKEMTPYHTEMQVVRGRWCVSEHPSPCLSVEGSCSCLLPRGIDGNRPPAREEPGKPLWGDGLGALPPPPPRLATLLHQRSHLNVKSFPTDQRRSCIQSLSCNLAEIEALGWLGSAAPEMAHSRNTAWCVPASCALVFLLYTLIPFLISPPDPRRQQSLLEVTLKSSWEQMLAGGSSLHCRGWCSRWCSLAGR